MALERIILNIIPAGDMPVFHCSQYENGRPVIIDLVSSDDDAFLVGEGVSVELHCRKCDDTIVTMEPDEVDNNTVTFVTSEQLTACPGDNLCELVLYSDTDPVQTLATLNFILHVEPDPLAGGLTSESEIYNLTQQIEDIAHEVIGEDYYNKTEVDGLISGVESQIPTKTSDLTNDSGFITSSDLTPYAKTADLATVATTGDYNDLLNKPTIPDAQIQSDWEQADNTKVDYIKNKPDIDAMIAAALLAVMPVGYTGPDAVASFDTALAADLVDCVTDIAPSLTGYTAVNLTANGDTTTIALGDTYYGGTLDVTTGVLTETHDGITFNGGADENWQSAGTVGTNFRYYIENVGLIKSLNSAIANIDGYGDLTPYSEFDHEFGTFRFATNGALIIHDKDQTFADVATFKTYLSTHNLKVTYELATPVTVQLSPTAVRAIVGTNNVYSDTGDTIVQYKDSIQHYIDTRL